MGHLAEKKYSTPIMTVMFAFCIDSVHVFNVLLFGESRGPRRKSITGTVSVTKLDRFCVVSCLAYMVRFARHVEQIYVWQIFSGAICVFCRSTIGICG